MRLGRLAFGLGLAGLGGGGLAGAGVGRFALAALLFGEPTAFLFGAASAGGVVDPGDHLGGGRRCGVERRERWRVERFTARERYSLAR